MNKNEKEDFKKERKLVKLLGYPSPIYLWAPPYSARGWFGGSVSGMQTL